MFADILTKLEISEPIKLEGCVKKEEYNSGWPLFIKVSTSYTWNGDNFNSLINEKYCAISNRGKTLTISNPNIVKLKVSADTNTTGLDLVNICCLFNGEKAMQYTRKNPYENKISYNNNKYEIQYDQFETVLPEIKNDILNIYKLDQIRSKKFEFTNINNLTTYVNDMNSYCKHIGYSGTQKFSFDLGGYILSALPSNYLPDFVMDKITSIMEILVEQKTIKEASEVTIPNDLNNDGIFIRKDDSKTTTIMHRNFIIDSETLFSYIKDYC